MNQGEDLVAGMAMLLLKQRFGTGPVSRADIEAAVTECLKFSGADVDPSRIPDIVWSLDTRLVTRVGRPTKLVDDRGHEPWYFGDHKNNRRFFMRYADFLLQSQQWAPATIEAIDIATDLVMEQIENPKREGSWDRRGLVVGHVQSGKTANYAGLVNKAADAGYKLIIVLAGMHNALRQQTQRRLDRDVLGFDTRMDSQAFARIGVGEFDRGIHAEYLTTQASNGDFSRPRAETLGMGVQDRPVIMVVKKNARILENLNKWVKEVLERLGDTESRPLLVIDDEADQASVDTGQQDFEDDETPDTDYEPKRINGQIRVLLSSFRRVAYVGYTATPFANVLIHDAAQADGFGDDLFPRSFIVNLPAPSDYVGPSLVFGIEGHNSVGLDDRIDVIRHIDQREEAWITIDHKKDYVPRYQGEDRIPRSLEDAILSFVLVCAARAARGQAAKHNSMLIHVSRFKDVHSKIFAQVDDFLGSVKRTLKYETGGDDLFTQLETLWHSDFEPASEKMRMLEVGRSLAVTSWQAVREQLANAADKIKTQVVNSEIRDAIDYEGNEAQGLSIIAIGGDKLSRGLTLEGLTVSYFLRASRMYDSLMQMGRWFGYRPGYVDLCRLYLTTDLELWFRHVAIAAEELRDRLDHMAMIGSTPEQYGLRIRSHDILLVTAQNKMRYAREFQVSFQGEAKIQTLLYAGEAENRRNALSITSFLDRIGTPQQPAKTPSYRQTTSRRVWKNVPGPEVAALLDTLEFPDKALDFSSRRLGPYIRELVAAGELTNWTIGVLSGDEEQAQVGEWQFKTMKRKPLDRGKSEGLYIIKTVLSPHDETLDLSEAELEEALGATNAQRAAEGEPPVKVPSGPKIRETRGKDPRRALLLLYPLSPGSAQLGHNVPVFGVVVSFPDSRSGRVLRYRFNTVEQRVEPV